jgi:hypothetical protein
MRNGGRSRQNELQMAVFVELVLVAANLKTAGVFEILCCGLFAGACGGSCRFGRGGFCEVGISSAPGLRQREAATLDRL